MYLWDYLYHIETYVNIIMLIFFSWIIHNFFIFCIQFINP